MSDNRPLAPTTIYLPDLLDFREIARSESTNHKSDTYQISLRSWGNGELYKLHASNPLLVKEIRNVDTDELRQLFCAKYARIDVFVEEKRLEFSSHTSFLFLLRFKTLELKIDSA
jgi:hypothetical protein